METKIITTKVCIAGGGPAGIVLGYLLARAGIEVIVLEKWPDFFRDFRGDTIHPSTMEILGELGLLEEFLKLPHNEVRKLYGVIGGQEVQMADFTHLKVRCPFVALIPQWDFLNFIAGKAKQYGQFKLMMQSEATDIIEQAGSIVGVRAKSDAEQFEIRAELTVGADGRHSMVREKSGLAAKELGVPIDVLWFKLSRLASDPEQSMGNADRGQLMVMLDRGDYWQCAFVIKKGQLDEFKKLGLENFRNDVKKLVPFLNSRMGEIKTWEQIKLLSVTVDHLQTWYKPGLVCIGDAAHAMSPIGGVGINLAIQDAVAAGNILIPKLKQGTVDIKTLAAIQNRRQSPTLKTQKLQLFLQNNIISKVISSHEHINLPLIFKIVRRFPYLSRFPAWALGLGFRPEHIDPDIFK